MPQDLAPSTKPSDLTMIGGQIPLIDVSDYFAGKLKIVECQQQSREPAAYDGVVVYDEYSNHGSGMRMAMDVPRPIVLVTSSSAEMLCARSRMMRRPR